MKKGAVVWLCGLAGSGKSTLARALREKLCAKFDNVIYLDGDELRELLGSFAYDKNGRVQVALSYARLAKFLSKQGQIVIVSTISLFREVYEFNRANLQNYFEIFIECDFDELKRRDQKGLYTGALSALARLEKNGANANVNAANADKSNVANMPNVVGVDIPYDTPNPHFTLNNTALNGLESKAQSIFTAFMNFYNQPHTL